MLINLFTQKYCFTVEYSGVYIKAIISSQIVKRRLNFTKVYTILQNVKEGPFFL